MGFCASRSFFTSWLVSLAFCFLSSFSSAAPSLALVVAGLDLIFLVDGGFPPSEAESLVAVASASALGLRVAFHLLSFACFAVYLFAFFCT